jgi:hypothetical protein
MERSHQQHGDDPLFPIQTPQRQRAFGPQFPTRQPCADDTSGNREVDDLLVTAARVDA